MVVCGELGVAEPLLHEVERDASGDCRDPEAVPQTFGRGVRALQDAAPRPETDAAAASALHLADPVHQVERVQQGRGTGTLR